MCDYCEQCGKKLEKGAIFCDECGFKVIEDSVKKTKFCFKCGEKIDVDAEICPHCGVRLKNPIVNRANDVVKDIETSLKGVDSFLEKITLKHVIIVMLIILILGIILISPTIIKVLTPYKEVNESFIANPVAGEKVQFDGVYIGHTTNAESIFTTITNNDVVKVGDHYIIIQGSYKSHDLYGNEGKTVHLEGRFAKGGSSTEPLGNQNIVGYWFGADKIEIVS